MTTAPTTEPLGRAAVPLENRDSLTAWFTVYMEHRGRSSSDHTNRAKLEDLNRFVEYFDSVTRSHKIDRWGPSITQDYIKHLQVTYSPDSIKRFLATLRHAAAWISEHRPFLAGNPFAGVTDPEASEPQWIGLEPIDVTRLKAAADQLLKLKARKNQLPLRDHAIFWTLLTTALRVSELVRLDLKQFRRDPERKDFILADVKRKGRATTRRVSVPSKTVAAIRKYIEHERGQEPGPLFISATGKPLSPQSIDHLLARLKNQANADLAENEKIYLSPHVLRHTCLRQVAEKHGVQYALELSGHSTDRYIWRYIKPREDKLAKAQEELF